MREMRVLILYGSQHKGPRRKLVHEFSDGKAYYVRTEVTTAPSDLDALDRAHPQEGETVLNTVEVP